MLTFLKKQRLQRDLLQSAVAQSLRISESLLSKIENGRYKPNPTLMQSVAKFYDVSQKEIEDDIDLQLDKRSRVTILKPS